MCVAYPVIDVQLVLANATFETSDSRPSADPLTTAFVVSGLQASR
jgi:hypothetical protein